MIPIFLNSGAIVKVDLFTIWPLRIISPESIASNPAIILNKELLPEALGPITEIISFSLITRLKSFKISSSSMLN